MLKLDRSARPGERAGRSAGRVMFALGGFALILTASSGVPAAEAEPPAPIVGIPAATGEAETLTLDRCIERALDGNLSLQRVRLRDDEISGQKLRALSTGLPKLDVVGTWSKTKDPSFALDESFGELLGGLGGTGGGGSDDPIEFDPNDLPASASWRGNLSSTWEVNPLRVWNAIGGVSVTRDQHERDVESEEIRIVDETIRTFHEAVLHQETNDALDAEIEARREFLDITRRRFELELSTELDTLQAAVAVANLLPERRRAATNRKNAAARLNLLMGREAMDPLALLPTDGIETDPIDPGLAMRAAADRPDLRSADLAIRFLEKRRGVMRADLKPTLSANGTYGWVGRDLNDLADRKYEAWQASVSLVLPLFDGLDVKGQTRELDAQISSARHEVEEARRRARLEVATTLEELLAARENHDAARLNVAAAELALERTTLRYELGKSAYLSLLNAQSERFSARSHLIEARWEVLSGTSALKRAMGFHPRTPLSRVREELEGSTQ